MPDNTRIDELRRRVQSDPASIAFAALAEEYRRGGQYEEAIATCRAGLQRHPAYLSAHVTLGRALIETGQYDEAREELEHVLRIAPENLAAIRGLAEIHHRRGEDHEAGEGPHSPGAVAQPTPPNAAGPAVVAPKPAAAPVATQNVGAPGLSTPKVAFEPAAAIPLSRTAPAATVAEPPLAADEPLSVDLSAASASDPETWDLPIVTAAPPPITFEAPVADPPALAGLEEFLAAILRARRESERRDGTPRR